MENSKHKNASACYDFIGRMFAPGIEKYAAVLKACGLGERKKIIDVGCGGGQWLFAAETLFPEASLIGSDPNREHIAFAEQFKMRHSSRCKFLNEPYQRLPDIFPEGGFDLVMCNSVIQYVDMDGLFEVLARLLVRDGVLIMFSCHGAGYYLRRLSNDIFKLDLKNGLYPLKVLLATPLGKSPGDHFMTFRGMRKNAASHGFRLEKAEIPELEALHKFMDLRGLIDCRGSRT